GGDLTTILVSGRVTPGLGTDGRPPDSPPPLLPIVPPAPGAAAAGVDPATGEGAAPPPAVGSGLTLSVGGVIARLGDGCGIGRLGDGSRAGALTVGSGVTGTSMASAGLAASATATTAVIRPRTGMPKRHLSKAHGGS